MKPFGAALLALISLFAGCVEPTTEDGGPIDGLGNIRLTVINDSDASIDYVATTDAANNDLLGTLEPRSHEQVVWTVPATEQNVAIALQSDERSSAGIYADIHDDCGALHQARWDGERWEYDNRGGFC